MEKQDSKADIAQLDNTTHKYDMWAKFSEDQKYLFNSFKEKITAMTGITEPVKNWLSDMTLWRYLRARKWNLKKSESMLTESIEWRQEFKPHEITRDEVVGVLELKTMYRNGKDLNRNPLLVITPGGENPYSVEKRVKALVYTIEECIESMEEKEHGVEKISIICDFSDYGSRARSPDGMKVMKQSIHILQNHYPERLGRAMIVNPPWFFHMLYKIASPWLDPVTKSKIYWIKGDKESLRKQMSEFIAPSQLEVRFGGDREKTIEPDLLEMKRQSMNNMNNTNINNTSTSNTTTEKSVSEKELKHADSKKSVKSTHSHEKSEENHNHKHDKHDNKEKEKHKKSHSKAKLKESNKKNSKTDVSNANE